MFKGDEDKVDDNLIGWEVVSVTKTLIEIDLEFRDPLGVSQGDNHDRLFVQVALSEYPDEYFGILPVSINKIKNIPRQFATKKEAELVEDAAVTVDTSTKSTFFPALILNYLLGTSLS